jgi:hypothetical protein
MRRAVVPAIADVVRFLCFFRGEDRQNLEKQRVIEEKAPRNKQNMEDFGQNLHPYWFMNQCFAACG